MGMVEEEEDKAVRCRGRYSGLTELPVREKNNSKMS